jgi:DNA-binding response OmpR family regulator
VRVLVVEDEPLMADAIRDGLRLEAIATDVAGDGDTALELLSVNVYDVAVLDRDIPGPSGDEIAARIVASGSGTPILMRRSARLRARRGLHRRREDDDRVATRHNRAGNPKRLPNRDAEEVHRSG